MQCGDVKNNLFNISCNKILLFFLQQEKGLVMLIFESRLGQNEQGKNAIKKRHESR